MCACVCVYVLICILSILFCDLFVYVFMIQSC